MVAHYIGSYIGDDKSNAIGSKTGSINGREFFCVHQNGRDISSGKLSRGVPYDPIGLHIFARHEKRYETGVCESGVKLCGKTFPCLFFGISKTIPLVVGDLKTFPVNKDRLVLQNPVTLVSEKYTGSLCVSYEIIGAVTGER